MHNDGDGSYLDGNAAAGAFAEGFGTDVSMAVLTCAACGHAARFAETRLYGGRGPGLVLRCTGCMGVVARMVRTTSDVWLDLQGSASWRIPALPPDELPPETT